MALQQPSGVDSLQTGTLLFGGGLNERTEETKINAVECQEGKNFDLDFQSQLYRRRRGLSLVASAPNGLVIQGGVQLIKSDDTRSFLIQAGNQVYEWDGSSGTSGMSLIATVSGNARLRGQIEANSVKDDTVLIADLNQVETVKTWNGTTFTALSHGLGSDFKARYAVVDNDRAFFANISANTVTPHLLVASKRDDFNTLSTSNRPTTSLGAGDAWFLSAPDLRPINGLIASFGEIIMSTRHGAFYRLGALHEAAAGVGGDVDNAAVALHLLTTNTASTGDEGLAVVGNSIVYSAQGRIDVVEDTDRFGDVQTNNLSRWLDVANISEWTMVYSPRWGKMYAVPKNGGKVHVLYKTFLDAELPYSPWSVWETDDSFNFEPTFTMRMLHPVDGLEYVFMGDNSGNLYQLEANTGADPNTTDVVCTRTSQAFDVPPGDIHNINGWVKYAKTYGGTLTLTFEYGGEKVFDESITISLDAADNAPVFGGSHYFGGTDYFGVSFGGRLTRSRFSVAGRSDQCQIKAAITGTADFAIESIGIQFQTTT